MQAQKGLLNLSACIATMTEIRETFFMCKKYDTVASPGLKEFIYKNNKMVKMRMRAAGREICAGMVLRCMGD